MQIKLKRETDEQRLIQQQPFDPWKQNKADSPPVYLKLQRTKGRKSVVFQDTEYTLPSFVTVEPFIDLCEPEKT